MAIEDTRVHAVAISQDGSHMVIRSADRVSIEERSTGKRPFTDISHSSEVLAHAIALSPDGRHIVTGEHRDATEDDRTIVTGEDDDHIRRWDTDAAARRVGKTASALFAPRSQPYSLAFSPDSRWLASTHADETLRICKVRTWEIAAEMRAAQWFGSCAWAPDGSRLYALGPNTLYRYDWRV